MRDPEDSGRGVCVEQRCRGAGEHAQIARDMVALLHAVLEEEGVPCVSDLD